MCVIDFTFDVRQRPLDGATFARTSVESQTSQFPGPVTAMGVSLVNVLEAPTSVTLQASPQVLRHRFRHP